MNWPKWFTPADCAEADGATRLFTDRAYDHMQDCQQCKDGPGCDYLRAEIDAIEKRLKTIGDKAFAEWTRRMQATYDTGKP